MMATFFDKAFYGGDAATQWMIKCRCKGEMSVRDMSDEAQRGYDDSDMYEVFEYRDHEYDVVRFAFWCKGDLSSAVDGLIFGEMEEFLAGLAPGDE